MLFDQGGTFACHETVDYTEWDYDQFPKTLVKPEEKHCAGAMILLEKFNQPNQMMRIAERLGEYDPKALDPTAPVFDTPDDFVEHHSE